MGQGTGVVGLAADMENDWEALVRMEILLQSDLLLILLCYTSWAGEDQPQLMVTVIVFCVQDKTLKVHSCIGSVYPSRVVLTCISPFLSTGLWKPPASVCC